MSGELDNSPSPLERGPGGEAKEGERQRTLTLSRWERVPRERRVRYSPCPNGEGGGGKEPYDYEAITNYEKLCQH